MGTNGLHRALLGSLKPGSQGSFGLLDPSGMSRAENGAVVVETGAQPASAVYQGASRSQAT